MNEADTIAGMVERRKRLDSHRRRLHKIDKEVHSGTDRGGALTAYFDGRMLMIADLEIGLSSRDVVDSLYYDNGHLILVRELVRDFHFVDRRSEFDFAHPSTRSPTDIFFLRSGKVVFSKPLDPSVNGQQRPVEVGRQFIQLSKILVRALHSRDRQIDLEHWITGN